MTASRLGRLAREAGEFLRFVLLWFGLGSVTAPLPTIVAAGTAQRSPLWLGPVVAAVLTVAVYWSVDRLSWRLVGRAWVLGIVVSVLSIVGFALFSPDGLSGLGAAVLLSCW